MGKLDDLMSVARDSLTVQRVYGEPFEKDGVTLIPAAAVRGGGGGGEGEGPGGEGAGSGSGFGMSARPVGAYQIKDEKVVWIPAVDVTRVAILGQIVAIIGLLVIRSIVRTKRSRS